MGGASWTLAYDVSGWRQVPGQRWSLGAPPTVDVRGSPAHPAMLHPRRVIDGRDLQRLPAGRALAHRWAQFPGVGGGGGRGRGGHFLCFAWGSEVTRGILISIFIFFVIDFALLFAYG